MTADTARSDPARRIGLFGGTFDPIHHGHLAAAWHVLQKLDLDEVWLVVANDPWQKSGEQAITTATVRLDWVRKAVSDSPGLVASDIEIERGGSSYTIDTVAALRSVYPGISWSIVVGADTAAQLDTWHRADELREMVDVVVVNRPGAERSIVPPGWRCRYVAIPNLDISSTELRSLAAAGVSLRFLVPAGVASDIELNDVYCHAAIDVPRAIDVPSAGQSEHEG